MVTKEHIRHRNIQQRHALYQTKKDRNTHAAVWLSVDYSLLFLDSLWAPHRGGLERSGSVLTQRSEAPRRAGVPATLTTGVAAAAL